jgi:DNA-binding CsgD family transcriptional regulator/PAS domain-containing protein
MSDQQLFLQTIEATYASGIDSDRTPGALAAASRLIGGVGGTLEVIDKATQRPTGFWQDGFPEISCNKYVEQYAPLSPRLPLALRQKVGDVAWDHKLLSEKRMDRDPFYAEFLKSLELRYYISLVLKQSNNTLAAVTIQRTPRQGHVGEREITLMRRIAPHFQRAFDMNVRLHAASRRRDVLENALDWLRDGVALLRADGSVLYTNAALQALQRRNSGLRILGRIVEFTRPEIRRRFATALNATISVRDLSAQPAPTDFVVPRDGGLPAYTVSLRPLLHRDTIAVEHGDAAVMMLIRDPLDRSIATSRILRELFGLTEAEAHLAQALCAGTGTRAYASERQVSITTVYTHLRRIREKTGCKSVAELVRMVGELDLPLRPR